MTDDELEEWLARYRPAKPPSEPRRHREFPPRASRDHRGWFAAAALVVFILVVHTLAVGERVAIRARAADTHDRERLIRELHYRLGAGEFSLQTARALIRLSDSGRDAE
jgi:hypothetical protein